MMLTSKNIKMHESGTPQLFRIRVEALDFIRITFTQNRNFATKDFPIIEVSNKGVDFCRHLQNGVSYSKKLFFHSFELGKKHDFFILTNRSKVIFGTFEDFHFHTYGFYTYDELDTLPYIGFSSLKEMEWTVEKGFH